MNKAVFLDRDGTLNVEKHYLHKIEDFELLPGVLNGLKRLQEAGFLLIIATNQSGIGRGYYSEEDFLTLNAWMIKILQEQGISVAKTYYCPHLPDAKIEKYRCVCQCRKPATGMFEQAALDFDIDWSQSFAVGDKIRDCTICVKTECKGFLIGNSEKPEIIKQVQEGFYKRVQYEVTLLDCAERIIDWEDKI